MDPSGVEPKALCARLLTGGSDASCWRFILEYLRYAVDWGWGHDVTAGHVADPELLELTQKPNQKQMAMSSWIRCRMNRMIRMSCWLTYIDIKPCHSEWLWMDLGCRWNRSLKMAWSQTPWRSVVSATVATRNRLASETSWFFLTGLTHGCWFGHFILIKFFIMAVVFVPSQFL